MSTKFRRLALTCVCFLGLAGGTAFAGENAGSFSAYVDSTGTIKLPDHYRSRWVFLGTWAVAGEEGKGMNFHNVYTQPETVATYRKSGRFPDGAVIVKELLKTESGQMTTGNVSWATQTEGWFVMVKDRKGRFKDNPLWGDGWGWALFRPGNRTKPVTENYKTECIPCHLPAKNDDWIYVKGYPDLKK